MFTLRQAIFERLKVIDEERRALADERRQLLDRLEQLEQQPVGIDASTVINTLNETVQALSELIPNVPASVVIQEVAKRFEKEGIKVEVKESEKKEVTPKIEEAVKIEQVTKPALKRNQNYSYKELAKVVIAFLRENGGKASNKEIEKYLKDEYGCYFRNLSQTMWQLRNADPRLKKGRQGYTILDEKVVPLTNGKAHIEEPESVQHIN